MDFMEFSASASQAAPPDGLDQAMQGLWWAKRGDWTRAHECAQAQPDRDGDAVHAYLHRVEGDSTNAAYWYRKAGKPAATGALLAEWGAISRALLG